MNDVTKQEPAVMQVTAAQFAAMTELLRARGTADVNAGLDAQRLVDVSAQAMPHSHHAGVTLIRGNRRPRTLAATDQLPLHVDTLQYTLGEGPCLDAAEGGIFVRSDDLAAEERWPTFGVQCAERLGVRSMLSVRLALSRDDRGALNFYSQHLGAFDDLDVATASMLAPFAALVVEQELHDHDLTNLEQALSTSRQIGAATGILMSQYRITQDEAFDILRHASQHLNRKLRDVAADVTETGELPQRRKDPRSTAADEPGPGDHEVRLRTP